MNVFKLVFTLTVIAAVLCGMSAEAGSWMYKVDQPAKPSTSKRKELRNPTVAEIQAAIAPRTRIEIVGTVDASNGDRLMVTANDVRLDFKKAKKVSWRGADNWGGFIEVSGQRVEVLNLKFAVASNSPGRCRGMVIHTPATDLRVNKCTFSNIADGVIADGEWARVAIENTRFLKCNDWASGEMAGGYGLFLEDDDLQPDHLTLSGVRVTLANSSDQHGIRMSMVERVLIENSTFGANGKRSMWAYGVSNMSVHSTTFNKGSVLFNLKTTEWQTDRPVQHVRMWNCLIDHDSILAPLSIFCGKGTMDFRIKDCDINSKKSPVWLEMGWREGSGSTSENIRWYNDTIHFNGNPIRGYEKTQIANDWSDQELKQLSIKAVK